MTTRVLAALALAAASTAANVQTFEDHLLIEGMAAYGFQLRHYGQDMRTLNGIKNRRGTYKYVDILFQRASTDEVFKAGR